MGLSERVLDAIELGVLATDPEGRFVYGNESSLRSLGIGRSELLGSSISEGPWVFLDLESREVEPASFPLQRVLRKREHVRGELLGIRQAGVEGTHWYVVDAVPMFDGDGGLEGAICTLLNVGPDRLDEPMLRDLNEAIARAVEARTGHLSRALGELRTSEARYRAIIDAMAEGVAVHAEDGSIVGANPAAQHILGLTVDQMRGRHPTDPSWRLTRADGSDLPPDEIPSEVTLRTGEPCTGVRLGVDRDGERRWLSVNSAPVRAADGTVVGAVATFIDVTARRAAVSALEQSEARFRRAIEAMPGVIVEARLRERGFDVLFVGGRVQELFGIEAKQVLADPELPWSLVMPDDARRARALIREAATMGEESEIDVRYHRGVEERWARIRTGAPTRTDEGLLVRCIVLDVTEERERAAARRQRQRSELLGSMAAGVAHNFNNMLAGILPNLEAAIERVADDEVRADLEVARGSAAAAADLVRRLVRLARHDQHADSRTSDLAEVTSDAVQICRRTFGAGIRIVENVTPGPVWVHGSAGELEQVVMNLCLNARDALADSPDPTIEVRLDVAGGEARVSVADNGTGLSEAVLEHLGDPFFTTKRTGEGTGLGIPTAIEVLSEVGGSIEWGRSEAGGALFEFRVPLAREVRPSPEASTGAAAVSWPGVNALVVDDQAPVRRTLSRMLERAGMHVSVAGDGRAGLERFGSGGVDVVFLDLSMPGMRGDVVLERIRALDETVPVVMITGYVPPAVDLASSSAILEKPFGLNDVREVLSKVLPSGGLDPG